MPIHRGEWAPSINYGKYELFSCRGRDYIVTHPHTSEPKHKPVPMPSNSYCPYFGYYYVYRGERELGQNYKKKEAFACKGSYFLTTEDHTASDDNNPFGQGKNLPFRNLSE